MNLYQQELVGSVVRKNEKEVAKPTTPRLFPMASSGPVTPLELENVESHFTSGVNTNNAGPNGDKLIHQERRG